MPFFSITVTRDEVAWLTKVTPRDRERPFRAMAPGGKYLLVMEGANHRMFSGQDNIPLPGSTPLPHVREVVTHAPTLFWRAGRCAATWRRRQEAGPAGRDSPTG